MLTYNNIKGKPDVFKAFTGLKVEDFDKLYKKIEGRKFKLELIDRPLMFLMYYKPHITYWLLGYLFNLDQSNICRNIKYLEPLVKACIPLLEKVEKERKRDIP